MEAPDMRGLDTLFAVLLVFAVIGLFSVCMFAAWAVTHVRISW